MFHQTTRLMVVSAAVDRALLFKTDIVHNFTLYIQTYK